MRIVFYNLNRLSYEGGAENYISDVANEMSQQGHEVYYVGDWRWLLKIYISLAALVGASSWAEAKKARRDLKKQPTLRSVNKGKVRPWQLNNSCFWPGSKRRRQTQKLLESADMVFVKNEVFEMWSLNWLTRKARKSLILFSSPKYPDAKTLRARLHNLFYTGWIHRGLLRDYRNLIVSNNLDKKFLLQPMRRPAKQIKKVPYGLKEGDFQPISANSNNDQFKVLFAGRFEEQKGIDYLEKIISVLIDNPKFAKLSFTVAGEGSGKEAIESLARKSKQVDYIGLVAKEEMNDLYNSHDLVIITSRWETFCYTCLEAQSCGLPVVTFDISGPNEMVIDNKTGRLIKPGDAKGFVSAIQSFYNMKLTQPNRWLACKRSAQERMHKLFSLNKVVKDLLAMSAK